MEDQKFWAEGELNSKDTGSIIKMVRENVLKLSQIELAEAMGTTESSLKKIENGAGVWGFNLLGKICKKYNLEATISVKQIKTEKEPSFKPA